MDRNWKKLTHDAWTQHILDKRMDVMGVLKFDNGRHITTALAEKLWATYWHKMDRMFFGHATKKGFGIERCCFTEYGADGRNFHMHFAALSPISALSFSAVANATWVNLNRRTATYTDNWIMPIQHKTKAAAYTSKSTQKQGIDEAGLRNTWRNADAQATLQFNTKAQILRIQNKITDKELLQAAEWAKVHLALSNMAYENRQAK